jgi:hypothetical protein
LGHPFFPPRWPWLGPCPGFDYARPLASPSARKGYSWTWRVSYWPSINAVVHAGSNPKRLFTDHSLLKKFFVESTEMTIPLNSGLLRFPAPYFCILVLIQNFVWIPFFFIDATNTEKANKIELEICNGLEWSLNATFFFWYSWREICPYNLHWHFRSKTLFFEGLFRICIVYCFRFNPVI